MIIIYNYVSSCYNIVRVFGGRALSVQIAR